MEFDWIYLFWQIWWIEMEWCHVMTLCWSETTWEYSRGMFPGLLYPHVAQRAWWRVSCPPRFLQPPLPLPLCRNFPASVPGQTHLLKLAQSPESENTHTNLINQQKGSFDSGALRYKCMQVEANNSANKVLYILQEGSCLTYPSTKCPRFSEHAKSFIQSMMPRVFIILRAASIQPQFCLEGLTSWMFSI